MNLKSIQKSLQALVLLSAISIGTLAHSADLLDEVKQRGTIRIGLEGTYPPFNYYTSQGKLEGFEIDLATALATELGVKPDFKPGKWDSLLGSLESQRIDIVMNTVGITDKRKEVYDFSQPYIYSGFQAIAKSETASQIKTADDLAGKKVGVTLGTNYETWLRANIPTAIIKTYDDDATKYQDLRIGRTDAVIADKVVLLDFIKRSGDKTLVVAGEPLSQQLIGIPVRKNNPEFLAAINAAFDTLRSSGKLKELSEKWFNTDITVKN